MAIATNELDANETCKSVTLQHVVHWIARAWIDVSNQTIQKCYNHVGIGKRKIASPMQALNDDEEVLTAAARSLGIDDVVITENLPTFHESIDNWEVAVLYAVDQTEPDNDDEDEDDDPVPPKPSFNSVFNSLFAIHNFLIHVPEHSIQSKFDDLKNYLVDCRNKSMVDGTLNHFVQKS
jgi:hypothetical protein